MLLGEIRLLGTIGKSQPSIFTNHKVPAYKLLGLNDQTKQLNQTEY